MLPGAGDLGGGHLGVVQAGVALRKGDRPQVVEAVGGGRAPDDAADVAHHQGVGTVVAVHAGREAALRGVEPVPGAVLLEDAAVGDAHPAVALRELVRMGHDGVGHAAGGDVGPLDVHVRAFDLGTAGHAGVVRDIQAVIGHEQVVVAVVVDDLRSLAALPVRPGAGLDTGGDADAVAGLEVGDVAVGPRIAEGIHGLAGRGIDLQEREAAVPGAVDEPVLAVGRDDVGRVDGVVVEVGVAVVATGAGAAPVTRGLGRGGAHHETLVLPGFRVGRVGGLGHADEGALGPAAVEAGAAGLDAVVHHDAVVHPELAVHHADDRRPVPVHGVLDGGQVHPAADVVQGVLHPRRSGAHRPVDMGPVHEVLGALALVLAADGGLVVLVSVRSGSAEHIVVTVIVGDGGVVDVGQVPVRVEIPVGDGGVVVGVRRDAVLHGAFVVFLGHDAHAVVLGAGGGSQEAAEGRCDIDSVFHDPSSFLSSGTSPAGWARKACWTCWYWRNSRAVSGSR